MPRLGCLFLGPESGEALLPSQAGLLGSENQGQQPPLEGGDRNLRIIPEEARASKNLHVEGVVWGQSWCHIDGPSGVVWWGSPEGPLSGIYLNGPGLIRQTPVSRFRPLGIMLQLSFFFRSSATRMVLGVEVELDPPAATDALSSSGQGVGKSRFLKVAERFPLSASR